MKQIFYFIFLSIICICSQSFRCGGNYRNPCTTNTVDTSIILFNVNNSAPTFKLYDTIWLSCIINDTFYNRTKSDYIISESNNYFTYLQPYKVFASGTNYSLNYANIEFNPVIADGSFNTYYTYGYSYSFRSNKPYNYLKVGFIAGKTGLYVLTMNSGYYGSDYNISVSNSTDYCKRFYTIQTVTPNQQNLQYWDSLQVSSLFLANSSASIIQKGKPNYIFFKVVP